MKLSDQITSLELSKKLKELGVEQESLFWWVQWVGGNKGLYYSESGHQFYNGYENIFHDEDVQDKCSAFTVAELGEMLRSTDIRGDIDLNWGYSGYNLHYKDIYETPDNNEANARALMLIYLLDNHLTEESK